MGHGDGQVVSEKLDGYETEVAKLKEEFADVFVDRPGFCNWLQHKIETGDAKPVRRGPYRLSEKKRANLRKQIREMLEEDIIVPSTSEWSSPVVMVEKKDQSYRFAVDYRALNAVTKASNYPIPTIDSILHSMHDSKFCSTLDLKSGFWQAAIHSDDEPKTAFVCEEGVYQFKRLPFGLRNASQNFQNLLDVVLAQAPNDQFSRRYFPYIDDIVVHSPTVREHFADLHGVLWCLRRAGLTVNPEKCSILYTRVRFLGYIIDY